MKQYLREPEGSPPIEFNGKRYVSQYAVSRRIGISSSQIERWASKGITRHGWPLRGVRKGLEVFLDEECVRKIEEERFQIVPGGKPAGQIKLGPTSDKSGYISGADAAEILGVGTTHLVSCCRRAANGSPVRGMEGLEIVRDTLEGNRQYYISEKSIRATLDNKRASKGILRIDRLIERP